MKQNQNPTPQSPASSNRPPAPASAVAITEKQLASAFTEWERRYREEPDRFMSEASKLLRETPETYGDACAPYLLAILAEQGTR